MISIACRAGVIFDRRAEAVLLTRLAHRSAQRVGGAVPCGFSARACERAVAGIVLGGRCLDGGAASAGKAVRALFKGIVCKVAVRIGLRLAGADNEGCDGACRERSGEACAAAACADRLDILACGGAVCFDAADLLACAECKRLVDSAVALVDRNNRDIAVGVLVCGNENIVIRLLSCADADCARAHPLGELCHVVAALGDLAVFLHRAVAAADVPPDISAQIADNETVVHILRDLNRLRPDIRRIRVAVRDIDLSHPDFLAAVLQLREVHSAALCAVEMRAEQIDILHGILIAEDRIVDLLLILEALCGHQFCLCALLDSRAVLCDEARDIVCAPVGPVMRVVRLILHGDGIQVDALTLDILDIAVQVLCVFSPLVTLELILAVVLVDVVADCGRRIPRGCEDGRAECLCTLGSRDSRFPRIAVITDIDSQDGKSQFIRTVAKCLLHLCIGHVALRDPLRQVDTAEAADCLISCTGINHAIPCSRRALRHNCRRTGHQHNTADCRCEHFLCFLFHRNPLFSGQVRACPCNGCSG